MLKHKDSLEFKWLVQHYFVLSTSPFPPTVIKIHHALLYTYNSDTSSSVQIGFQPSDLAVSYMRSLQIQKSALFIFFCDLSFMLDEVKIWLFAVGMQPWGTIAASE